MYEKSRICPFRFWRAMILLGLGGILDGPWLEIVHDLDIIYLSLCNMMY